MQRRKISFPITDQDFERLEALAQREERIAEQQAAYMLKQALERQRQQDEQEAARVAAR
jgi:hypothetical protein